MDDVEHLQNLNAAQLAGEYGPHEDLYPFLTSLLLML
jgi:hypothetical protein